MEFTREIQEALSAPFPEDEIEFLPRAHSNGKALGLAYIDARDVMRRLDAVVGPANWSFDFDVLSPDGKLVRGKLTVCGVTKCDAGEANTEDELLKSAVSDALKRTAVHFGIGRYLYYLPRVWAPYDNQRRTWSEAPRIAPAALEKALATCGVSSPRASRDGVPARPSIVNGGLSNRNAAAKPPVTEDAMANPQVETSTRLREAPAAEAPRRPEVAAAAEATPATSGAGKKSPWSAGATRQEAGAPESSGDRAASRSTAPVSSPAANRDMAALICSTGTCGKPLTKGQHDMSVRAFGEPLCPACQKERARSAA